MKHHNMLPFRSTASVCLALLGIARTATALTQSLCSSQNTGADSYLHFDNYQSNGACYTSCQNGYAFAIVQYQSCWCSNYYPAETVNTSECDDTCPGYPDEECGSEANNLFGYVMLPNTPSGTAGGSSTQQPTSTTQQTSSSQASTSPSSSSESSSSSEPSTVSETVFQTVTPDPTTAYVVSTASPTSTSEPSSTSTPTSSTTTFATSSSTSSPPQSTQSPYTSVEVVTISGAQVTQTVTSTPLVANPDANNQQPVRRTGLSAGAIAGVVIGVILGVALLLVGAFFLWRRKRGQENASVAGTTERKSPMRNTSVLSKTGLLARSGTKRHTREWDDPLQTNTGGANSARHSQLYGAGVFTDDAVSPVSPLGDQSDHDSRRHSKPLVYDQRLNPSALWASQDANSSRISMQDTQDYSRPLGVMNPDLRKSTDSRTSFN